MVNDLSIPDANDPDFMAPSSGHSHTDDQLNTVRSNEKFYANQSTSAVSTETKKNVLPPSYQVGKLPKYLVEMREREAEKSRLDSRIDPHCPAGHTVLSDEERLDALNVAEKKRLVLIDELNRMPMTSRTLRIRNRQIEIEKELNKLDDIVKLFSRLKVYVKNEDMPN